MTVSAWGTVATALGVIVAALAVFLGVPQWKMVRRQLETSRKADRNHELLLAARSVLMGDNPEPKRSPDNPSILDLLTDMRDALSEQAELAAIVAHHISDGHGGEQPPWLRRERR